MLVLGTKSMRIELLPAQSKGRVLAEWRPRAVSGGRRRRGKGPGKGQRRATPPRGAPPQKRRIRNPQPPSRQVLDRDDREDLVGPADADRALVPINLKDARLGVVLPDGLARLPRIAGTRQRDRSPRGELIAGSRRTSGFQTTSSPSQPALARKRPLGENESEKTVSVWALSTRKHASDLTSHRRIVSSYEPLFKKAMSSGQLTHRLLLAVN
jgi:hypothetical protein